MAIAVLEQLTPTLVPLSYVRDFPTGWSEFLSAALPSKGGAPWNPCMFYLLENDFLMSDNIRDSKWFQLFHVHLNSVG